MGICGKSNDGSYRRGVENSSANSSGRSLGYAAAPDQYRLPRNVSVNLFYGAKVLNPAILCVLVLVTALGYQTSLFTYIAALVLGFLAPGFWLERRIAKRQPLIRLGLPDALDLSAICVEGPLGIA
jgi:pilus assembly protein TadC